MTITRLLPRLAMMAIAGLASPGEAQTRTAPESETLKASAPTLVWERVIDVEPMGEPRSDELRYWHGPLGTLRGLTARPDGGALFVAHAANGEAARLVAIDGAGKDVFRHPLTPPAGRPKPGLFAATINGEAADKAWLLSTWSSLGAGDRPPVTELLAVDATGRAIQTRGLPPAIGRMKPADIARKATVLRRLKDGSLVAGGTAWHAPPVWWYARFTTTGNLLHEAVSAKFPDHVVDARGNEDGGYSLLMVDAGGGRETATIRRHGADGKLLARNAFDDVLALGCAVLVGPTLQLRVADAAERSPGAAPGNALVLHDVDRAVRRRVDLGTLRCTSLARAGDALVMVAEPAVETTPPTRIVVGFASTGEPRWRLDPAGEDVVVAPLADGGALVARVDKAGDKPVVKLARYRSP